MIHRCFSVKSWLAAFVGFLFLLNSCSDPEINKVEPEPEPDSLPVNRCAGDIVYGYCNKQSFLPGEKVVVYIQSRKAVALCKLTVYDLMGNEVFAVESPLSVQQISVNDPAKNGYDFHPSVEITLPESMRSGIYMIERSILFVVKSNQPVDVLVVYPSNTTNAYATSGGKSLYTLDRPFEVSFHRPINLQGFSSVGLQWFYNLQMVSVGYIADADLDNYAAMSNGKILCLIGHHEYWTRRARNNFDQFVNSGNHALVLSGNVMWWQVRYSDDATKMICYKSFDNDPVSDPLLKTALWNHQALDYPVISSIGADFDRGGYGLKADGGWNGYKIVNERSPLLEGTGLRKGDIISCPTVEYDGAPLTGLDANGFPILDLVTLNVHRAELIGFDIGFRNVKTYGTFIVLQRSPTSGIIINTASTDWCSANGMGGSSAEKIKTITRNAISKLLQNDPVFSP